MPPSKITRDCSNMKEAANILITIVFILAIGSLILNNWYPLPNAARILFGSSYLLFLPGFIWSYIFFSKKSPTLSERIIVSFLLSITLITVLLFFINAAGIKITAKNTIIITTLTCFSGLVTIIIRKIIASKLT